VTEKIADENGASRRPKRCYILQHSDLARACYLLSQKVNKKRGFLGKLWVIQCVSVRQHGLPPLDYRRANMTAEVLTCGTPGAIMLQYAQ
jgi:hypothetical protein